ncbi:hypothetical protein [Corallococcus exiguus]|uniref:hypothetical protein n=1 Tax=Corallococcus exiguus TaxID=83462 RepID=UPI0014941AEE|nr:hypothetical protein [Corallococcus exiguus]NPD27458.1 hypothetical protein [Corallococcus exiguus]
MAATAYSRSMPSANGTTGEAKNDTRNRVTAVPLFREWELPEVQLQSAKGSWRSPGMIRLYADSRIEVEITFGASGQKPIGLRSGPVRISGATTEGLVLRTTRAALLKSEYGDGGERHVFVPFQLVLSKSRSKPISSAKFYVKNMTRYMGIANVRDGEHVIRIVHEGSFQNFQFGASIEVSGGRISMAKAKKTVEDVANLASLAARCPCIPCFGEYYSSSELQRVEAYTSTVDCAPVSPLVPLQGEYLGGFIEQSLPRLRVNEATLRVALLIYYYCRSHQETTLEVKFLLSSVFMEAAKFNYALNVAQYVPDKKANGVVRGFLKPNQPPGKKVCWSFDDLVKQAAKYVGVTRVAKRTSFIENRNCIFHSGESSFVQTGRRRVLPALMAELVEVYGLMDDFLLRLLGYRGPFSPYRDGRMLAYPSRRPFRRGVMKTASLASPP